MMVMLVLPNTSFVDIPPVAVTVAFEVVVVVVVVDVVVGHLGRVPFKHQNPPLFVSSSSLMWSRCPQK